MPYDIVAFPDGYRLQTQNGSFLSDKPMTLDAVKKQMSAIGIQKSKGGAKAITIPHTEFVKEHKKLLGILKRPTKAKLEAEYADQSSELSRVLRGGDVPPSVASRNLLGNMAEDAYKKDPPKLIEGWELVHTSPTIKAYRKHNVIIIEARGTVPTEFNDLKADAVIPASILNTTKRYKIDVEEMRKIKRRFPRDTYYAVGHSLGGAIVDNLINDGWVKEGISFNPAVESKFYDLTLNKRISHKDDPLLALMTNRAKGTEVIDSEIKQKPLVNTGISWLDNVGNTLASPFAWVQNRLKAHNVSSIFGRGRGSCGVPISECKCDDAFKQQLAKDGYDCKKYLTQARLTAKKAGYDPTCLDFAHDTHHKLAYTTPSGKVVRFGRKEYGDFIIYKHLERIKKVAKGYALTKRNTFHASHQKIKGKWRSDMYSPNNLALSILW
jgi:hypothetical protein